MYLFGLNKIIHYIKEIVIEQSRLNGLPVDGDINVSVRFIADSKSMDCDRDPVKENEEEVETSFLPEKT